MIKQINAIDKALATMVKKKWQKIQLKSEMRDYCYYF